MRIIIENTVLIAAVKKASLSLGKTFTMNIKPSKTGDGYNLMSLKTSDGVTMTETVLPCKTEEQLESPMTVHVTGGFMGAVQTLAQYCHDDFILDIEDHNININCGSSKVSVARVETAELIKNCNPKKQPCIAISFEGSAIKKAIFKGGCAFSYVANGKGIYNDIICFHPISSTEEQPQLEVLAVDINGAMLSGSKVGFNVLAGDSNGLKDFCVSGSYLFKVAEQFSDENVVLFIFESQVIIQIKNDFYTLVVKSCDFRSEAFEKSLFSPVQSTFSVEVDNKEMIAAVNIAALNLENDLKNRTVFQIDNGKLTIKSEKGQNTTSVASEGEGSIEIGINAAFVKNALSHCSSDVKMSGTCSDKPVYFTDDDNSAILILPFGICNSDDEDE